VKKSLWIALGFSLMTHTGFLGAQTPMPHELPLPQMQIPRTGETVSLPSNDADVVRLLDYGDTMTTTILRNLYQLYRQQGHDVMTAFEKTLRAHIEIHEKRIKDD